MPEQVATFSDLDEVSAQQVALTRLKTSAQLLMHRELLRGTKVETSEALAFAVDRLAIQLVREQLAVKICDQHVSLMVETPATWWDHLKETLSHKLFGTRHGALYFWWLRRHPVRFDVIRRHANFQAYTAFPAANIDYPAHWGEPNHVEFLTMEDLPRPHGGSW